MTQLAEHEIAEHAAAEHAATEIKAAEIKLAAAPADTGNGLLDQTPANLTTAVGTAVGQRLALTGRTDLGRADQVRCAKMSGRIDEAT
jgi:hypothetical protein